MKIVDDTKSRWNGFGTPAKIAVGSVAVLLGIGVIKAYLNQSTPPPPADPINADEQKLLATVKNMSGLAASNPFKFTYYTYLGPRR